MAIKKKGTRRNGSNIWRWTFAVFLLPAAALVYLFVWSQSGEPHTAQTEIRRAALSLEQLAVESLSLKLGSFMERLSKAVDENASEDGRSLFLDDSQNTRTNGVLFQFRLDGEEGFQVIRPAVAVPKQVWPFPGDAQEKARFDILIRELEDREFLKKDIPGAEAVLDNMVEQFEAPASRVRVLLYRAAFLSRQGRFEEVIEDLIALMRDVDPAAAEGPAALPFVLSALLLFQGQPAVSDPAFSSIRDEIFKKMKTGGIPLAAAELRAVAGYAGLFSDTQQQDLLQRAIASDITAALMERPEIVGAMQDRSSFAFIMQDGLWVGSDINEKVVCCAFPAKPGLACLLDASALNHPESGLALTLEERRLDAQASASEISDDIDSNESPLMVRSLSDPAGIGGAVLRINLTNPTRFEESVESRRTLVVTVAISLIAVMFVSGFATMRAVRREVAAARARSDFMAAVSHELRTPLASIRMFAELIEDDRVKEVGTQQRFMRLILSNCRRLSAMIENVLDFSRSEKGMLRFHLEEVDLKKLLEDFFHDMKAATEEDQFVMEVDIAPDLPYALVDPHALARVLFNLCDNACKYAGEDRRIEVRAFTDNKEICIAIKDFGPGIPEAEQGLIFERFYRGKKGQEGAAGAGLGLSLTCEAVEACKGRIELKSKEGEGTTFFVYLPGLDISNDES